MNGRNVCAVLVLAACQRVATSDEHSDRTALEERVAALTDELAQCRAGEHTERELAQTQLASLRTELDRAVSARVARETEWLRYSKAISNLGAQAQIPTPDFAPDPATSTAQAPAPESDAQSVATVELDHAAAAAAADTAAEADRAASDAAARADRDRAIFLALRSLFAAERVLVFDLMETGTLQDGATGPVVLRTLDEMGRPTGAVCAARLRLEASRAARTLTLVLEDGYERRGTDKLPFHVGGDLGGEGVDEVASSSTEAPRGGVRRIVLPEVDPSVWIEALPELFTAHATTPIPDDGRWNLVALRNVLNLLLREDAASGWWRLAGIGGVRGSVLCDVALDQLDREGRLERKLFADRLSILREDRGLQLLLESGAQVRSDRKIPFLDGRYRIFLPRADADAWASRGVPGLSPPPPR